MTWLYSVILSYILWSSRSITAGQQSDGVRPLPLVKTAGLTANSSNTDDQDQSIRSHMFSKENIRIKLPEENTSLPAIDVASNLVPDQLTAISNRISCSLSAKCTAPTNSSLICFGTELGYAQTSFAFSGLQKSWKVQQALRQWEGLRALPACWKVIQPLICGVYLPKCELDRVQLVPVDLCRVVQNPCRLALQINPDWAELFNCDAPQYRDCKNDERSERLRFNTTATCLTPLVPTQETSAYHEGVEGCGMECESPLLSAEEYARIKTFIGIAGTISLACTLFASATFLIDWSGASKYPALAIFYVNVCFFLASLGWLAQLGAKSDIVCRKDGTLRQNEPGSGENLSCVVVFILVYYFTMAAGVWLVILTYTWSVFFTNTGKVKDVIEPKAAYFHMFAWFLPLVLTIIIMAINRVDASSLYGICYVGFSNILTRILFLLLPYFIFLSLAGFFSARSMAFLASVSINFDYLSEKETNKVQSTLIRMGMFCGMTALFAVVSACCHVYEFIKMPDWRAGLRDLVLCNLKREVFSDTFHEICTNRERPSLTVLELQLLCMFGAGILASSWVWTKESLNTWRLFLCQLLTKEKPARPLHLRKHEVIAQAFAKRQDLQATGRLSLSFHSTHVDPLGMNIRLEAESSGEFSSTFAAALPHLVQRRGGLCGAEQLGLRRNSLDSMNSQQSVSAVSRGFSWFESRKQSLDSQSLRQSDLDRLQHIYDETLRKSSKRSKRNFFKAHASKMKPWSRLSSRRTSVASRLSENSLNSQILPAITLDPARLARRTRDPEAAGRSGGGRRAEFRYTVPEPGRSTDFGQPVGGGIGILPGDPGYRELEERLRQLATSRTSANTDRDGSLAAKSLEAATSGQASVAVQTSLTDLTTIVHHKRTKNRGTQMTPQLSRHSRPGEEASPSTPATTTTTTSSLDLPLRHVEANVVSVKVQGPSSEDSSIPSSYEKDFKMKKLSPRGKENIRGSLGENLEHEIHLNVGSIEIPALKPAPSGPLIRPRDHQRGRRGAIVGKLSPSRLPVDTSGEGGRGTDTTTSS